MTKRELARDFQFVSVPTKEREKAREVLITIAHFFVLQYVRERE